MNPKEFVKQWNKWSFEVPQRICNDYQAAVVRIFFMYLMTYTPIDTGRLRGNWKASIDTKPKGSSKARRTDATSTGAPATAQEVQYIEALVRDLRKKPIGRVVWIGNLTNYAKFVEFGTRKMLPRAMMERATHSTKARMSSNSIRWKDIGT